jgi:hypothetical protein
MSLKERTPFFSDPGIDSASRREGSIFDGVDFHSQIAAVVDHQTIIVPAIPTCPVSPHVLRLLD